MTLLNLLLFAFAFPLVQDQINEISDTQFVQHQLMLYWGIIVFLTLLLIIAIVFIKNLKEKVRSLTIDEFSSSQIANSLRAQCQLEDAETKQLIEELQGNVENQLVTLNMFTNTLLKSTLAEQEMHFITKIQELARHAHQSIRSVVFNIDVDQKRKKRLENSLIELFGVVKAKFNVDMVINISLNGQIKESIYQDLYTMTFKFVIFTLKTFDVKSIRIDISEVNNEYISYIYELDFKQPIGIWTGIKDNYIIDFFYSAGSKSGITTIDKKQKEGFTIISEIPL